jgi:hypothetical protein
LGLAATDGDTLYYITSDGDYDLIYKAAADGVADEAIIGFNGYNQFLNVSDGYFYFIGVTYDNDGKSIESVFRADLNGESRQWLFDIDECLNVSYMRVFDRTLFYVASTAENETTIYTVNIESGNQTALVSVESTIQSVNFTKNDIYYVNGTEICRVNQDGSEKEMLYRDNIWIGNMILSGDTLYFVETQKDQTDSICALNIDGGEVETLISGANWINYLNIEGQTLYYANHIYEDNNNLQAAVFYKVDIAGGETTAVGETNASYVGFSIIGGNLIYQVENNAALTANVIPLSQ